MSFVAVRIYFTVTGRVNKRRPTERNFSPLDCNPEIGHKVCVDPGQRPVRLQFAFYSIQCTFVMSVPHSKFKFAVLFLSVEH